MTKWLDKYKDGGFVGLTTEGRNFSPAWGGQFQNGGVKELPETEVVSISPRQQAYNDSLNLFKLTENIKRSYNKSSNILDKAYNSDLFQKWVKEAALLDEARDSGSMSDKEWEKRDSINFEQYEKEISPLMEKSKEKAHAIYSKDVANYVIHSGDLIGTPYDRTQSKKGMLYQQNALLEKGVPSAFPNPIIKPVRLDFLWGNNDGWNFIPSYQKPVYNPSENIINRLPAKEITSPTFQQPTINPTPVSNGFTTDLPGYGGLKVQHSQDGRPMWIVDQKGNRQPVVDNDLTPRIKKKRNGGVVKDNLGYWNPDNEGKIVEIDSPEITMRGVGQPLMGVSDEGDVKLMKPGKDYKFKGKKVREYPIAKYGINELHQLQDFTNKPSSKNWLTKYL